MERARDDGGDPADGNGKYRADDETKFIAKAAVGYKVYDRVADKQMCDQRPGRQQAVPKPESKPVLPKPRFIVLLRKRLHIPRRHPSQQYSDQYQYNNKFFVVHFCIAPHCTPKFIIFVILKVKEV